jgi:tetratricopeptide (TPR) repeat protein
MALKTAWSILVVTLLLVLGVLTHGRNVIWEDSIALWRDTVAKSPGKARPRANYAVAIRREGGDDARADAAFRKALALNPKNHAALLGLGVMHAERGEYGAAREYLERGVNIYPDSHEIWHSLGIVYEEQGMPGEAEAAYRRALSIRPGYVKAVIRLGHLLRVTGREQEMRSLMREAVRRNPELLEVQPYLREMLGGPESP